MEYLVSGTGLRIPEGSVVMLARFPGSKWVVRNGWYSYQGNQYMGWYFSSIPAQVCMPVNDEDLTLLTVISTGDCITTTPDLPRPAPRPQIPDDKPKPIPGPPQPDPNIVRIDNYLDKTFITVNTIEERDRLRFMSLIPDGKLVRVNHVEDEGAKYYRYDGPNSQFVEIKFENEVSGSEFEELKESVEDLSDYTHELDESVNESINELQSDVTIINNTLDEIHESINTLNCEVDTMSWVYLEDT